MPTCARRAGSESPALQDFSINGRVISGAQPIEAFEAIIDEELTLKGIEVPPKEEPEEAAEETTTE